MSCLHIWRLSGQSNLQRMKVLSNITMIKPQVISNYKCIQLIQIISLMKSLGYTWLVSTGSQFKGQFRKDIAVLVQFCAVYGHDDRKSSRPKPKLCRPKFYNAQQHPNILNAPVSFRQVFKNNIYYSFIPLVSSHHLIKKEICCTDIHLACFVSP